MDVRKIAPLGYFCVSPKGAQGQSFARIGQATALLFDDQQAQWMKVWQGKSPKNAF